MALEEFQTAQAKGFPTVRQLSVFLENRVGQLLQLAKVLDPTDIRIIALSVVHSVDCAILRLLVDDPDEAHTRLTEAGFAVSQTELMVVVLPPGKQALLTVCSALLAGEVNIDYAYPLLVRPHGRAALALQVDDREIAATVLRQKQFDMLDEADLKSAP